MKRASSGRVVLGLAFRWSSILAPVLLAAAMAPAQEVFQNPTSIQIPDHPGGPATSSIDVVAPGRVVTKVSVTLYAVSHSDAGDLELLLVSPTGKRLLLQDGVGARTTWVNRTYTVSDAAASHLPCNALPPALARPTKCGTANTLLGPPAPPPPYITPGPDIGVGGSRPPGGLSSFNGDPADGTWLLYVRDDLQGNEGVIAGGWGLTVWASPHDFSNRDPLVVPDNGPFATSSIAVSGFPDEIAAVSVTLFGLNHPRPDDLDVFLEAPSGKRVVLQSDAGGSVDAVGLTYSVDPFSPPFPDTQPEQLSDRATWGPANYAPSLVEEFPVPVYDPGPDPAPGSTAGSLGHLVGEDANGEWTLHVRDDLVSGEGQLSGGWALSLAAEAGSHVKGDLTGDRQADLLLRNADNEYVVWAMNESARLREIPTLALPGELSVVGVADYSGNGTSDFVIYDQTSGEVSFLPLLLGLAGPVDLGGLPPLQPLTGASPLSVSWKLSATADFNNDANPDILWRNTTSQKLVIWTLNRFNKVGAVVPTPDAAVHANWEVVAALDFDANGTTDLLWYNGSSGKVVIWYMDASVVRTAGQFTNPENAGNNNWKVVAAGDYGVGADGPDVNPPASARQDLVWRNTTSGKLVLWYMNGSGQRTSGVFLSPDAPSAPLEWQVAGPR